MCKEISHETDNRAVAICVLLPGVSKIEAGKLEIDAINFNLGDGLSAAMRTLSLRAHQKGLELAFEVQPDVPDALIGDPGRLRQVCLLYTSRCV